ncbi:DUF3107 domain-containing protein [Buchananella felis]|uniref:DUF3107 domain-containing protein n=1 Tax=Buchananella felis TaxID=3231492 RepID=UPI00352904D6
MNVVIGIKHVATTVNLRTNATPEEVRSLARAAIRDGELLELQDVHGGSVVVDGDSIAYVEIGEPGTRKVGFGIA